MPLGLVLTIGHHVPDGAQDSIVPTYGGQGFPSAESQKLLS